ncbi:hypothetical protein RM844_31395 [Streptomyces sp. DSM 44915]|uniref:Collagen-like protein n=1 Tax=Streptomyces chisholmiae TaxID=3075540 RepID=A0ABU2K1X5_9ACTN|nr:hypothetical protein [Streptomyces sp. DSM 44915]MDT0270784.1 hypothetical protein [Streptomyces sp. DSM 44915]
MSHIQGWPGPAGAPGPGGGPDQSQPGRRLGILVLVVVLVTGLSFGLAAATGADSRDNGGMAAPPGMSGMEGLDGGELPDLEGLEDLPDLESTGGGDLGGGDLGGGDLGGGDLGGGDLGGGDSGSLPTEEQPTEQTPPDPTMELFRSVSPGHCLANWMTGETDWVSVTPEIVDCSADNAGVWVATVDDSVNDCPVDAGRSYLYYTYDAETVALCVTRVFEVGQCFLGMADGSANLMSWIDCQGGTVPSPYSQKFNVIAVYSAPSNPTGNECSSAAGNQQYYWWTMDAEQTLLCAVVYSG